MKSPVKEPIAERARAGRTPPAETRRSAEGEPPAEPAHAQPAQPGLAPSEFAGLYAEHSRAIYYLALRFLGDPQKAEDATHDVFLKAFKKMDQFRGEASWRTWLYRIAINHCRNLQQAWNERHLFSNADEAIWESSPAKTDSPFRILETKELGERIQKTLDALPAEYRLLLLLVADEELSYEEVGALTEQSSDAVRGKLHRARKAFAALFEKTD
jgi:RNA polymerase sigma-70 factor (ECF subfamily)